MCVDGVSLSIVTDKKLVMPVPAVPNAPNYREKQDATDQDGGVCALELNVDLGAEGGFSISYIDIDGFCKHRAVWC